jgi:hypothetical protein
LAQHHGRYFSLVRNGETYETREVVISSTNDKVATIKQGLAPGDLVVLSPRRAGNLLDLPDLSRQNVSAIADSLPSEQNQGGLGSGKPRDRDPPEPAGGGE